MGVQTGGIDAELRVWYIRIMERDTNHGRCEMPHYSPQTYMVVSQADNQRHGQYRQYNDLRRARAHYEVITARPEIWYARLTYVESPRHRGVLIDSYCR